MKTNQEQVLNAISGLIPEDAQKEVNTAISSFLEGALTELETNLKESYETNLKEAYEEHQKELNEAKKIAEEGYGQAWEVITDLRDRIEIQKEEFEQTLEEGYEEAYAMIQEERAKNDTLEVDLYEEYDRRFADIKEYMVDKLDQFLQLQDKKYLEMAKRDVMNDPAVAEHRLAFDRVIETVSDFISDEDYAFATSAKVENLQKSLEETKGQLKILESKNMRLSMENTKLNESVRQQHELMTEQVAKSDRKARVEKSRKAEGRGLAEPDKERQKVIAENTDEPVAEHKNSEDRSERFAEHVGEEVFADWKHLSGLNRSEGEE
jgi:hypothetical protein